jgi:hypothetical protein
MNIKTNKERFMETIGNWSIPQEYMINFKAVQDGGPLRRYRPDILK